MSPELRRDLDPDVIRDNLARVRAQVGDAVEILLAAKYVPVDELEAVAEAGITVVGENRLQDLQAKQQRWRDRFAWDFIGNLQSRKAPELARRVRLIHSLASDSALRRLAQVAPGDDERRAEATPADERGQPAPDQGAGAADHGPGPAEATGSAEGPPAEVLVQVDLAGEETKGGIAPASLGEVIDRCPLAVTGLMTMPPATEDPERSRPVFARLAELAAAHGLARLSMGTSQDYAVAAQEGATIVRLGSTLLDPPARR